MADALVSIVLEQLSSIVFQEVGQEVRLVVGVDNEVDKLARNFRAIQAVFADAEERQLKDQLVKHWLDQLKDVSYDMDDILDEWGTAIAKSKMKVNEHPRKTAKKVCSFMIFSCFRFREVGLRHDIAHKIRGLNERIDKIVVEKDRFHFKSFEVGIKQFEHQKTTSVIDASEVKGREKDKDGVMKMLLSERSQGPALRTISLVGMGGIGKTTLAKLVYNDHDVTTHFDKKIWVCVSDPFNEITIAKAILEALKGFASDLNELQTLLESIQSLIGGKKFLLVLDDVWNEDSTKWEQLKDSLKCGLPGSRILVTTRNKNVASSMGSSPIDISELGLLSTEECWSLFSKFACLEKTSKEYDNLEDIGRQIAAKCKGLPLAAKSLGSLLRFKSRIEEWESVLNSHVWEIKEAESKILAPLWLSYNDLPSDMRQCFSYCAVFPKDFTFDRGTLIKLWMAQGFLRETQNKEMEVIGRECFEALAARSFFQDFEKEEGDGSIYACKMHDMVHDFAQNLTKNECFSVDIDGVSESKIDSFSRDARHSMVVFRNYKSYSFPATIHSLKKLRSLIVDDRRPPSMNAALPNLIANLSCLRTLRLSGCGIEEVPSNIGKLIHLRYVDLSGNENIKELPEEMCELYNMLTLDVSDCEKLERLPDNIGRLVKLRHLCILSWGESQFVKMRGVEGLGSLRELDEFHVSGSDKESNIGDLRNLNHLQGSLTISWLGDVKDPDEVKKAELKSKKHLTHLGLRFESRTDRRIIRDDEVLEALEPPPNLKSLMIRYYQGVILLRVFPGWINKLRVVRLFNWSKIENLPPLGKLPSLEKLTVSEMGCVGRVGREFLGLGVDSDISIGEMTSSSSSSNAIIAFPMLKSLSFSFMGNWEEWEGGNEDKTNISISTIMPSLRSLEIWHCPKLKALPDYVLHSTTLEQLTIRWSPILRAQFKAGGKGWPNTSHTPNITINVMVRRKPSSSGLSFRSRFSFLPMAPRKKAEETKSTSSEKPATRRSARMTRSTAKRFNAKLTELPTEPGKKRKQEKAAESKKKKVKTHVKEEAETKTSSSSEAEVEGKAEEVKEEEPEADEDGTQEDAKEESPAGDAVTKTIVIEHWNIEALFVSNRIFFGRDLFPLVFRKES
ncbi:disease resistance protein RGA3 [Populus alba x Populus x berolinensis]|nr:disease resistance protein RGA3 [Populus alba x Populus x berolinensis]